MLELSFSRNDYLEFADKFEANKLDSVDPELSEFNNDIEDIAFELAYTRYALAKEELEAEALRKELAELQDGLTTAYMVGYGSGRDSLMPVIRHLCNVYILDDYYTGDDRAVMLNRVVEKQIVLVDEMRRRNGC